MIFECLTVGLFDENCYILGDEKTGEAILFDPGDEAERIMETVTGHNLYPTRIINTHAHVDHVMAVGRIQRDQPEWLSTCTPMRWSFWTGLNKPHPTSDSDPSIRPG